MAQDDLERLQRVIARALNIQAALAQKINEQRRAALLNDLQDLLRRADQIIENIPEKRRRLGENL